MSNIRGNMSNIYSGLYFTNQAKKLKFHELPYIHIYFLSPILETTVPINFGKTFFLILISSL
jgi:hypothetical protein